MTIMFEEESKRTEMEKQGRVSGQRGEGKGSSEEDRDARSPGGTGSS